MKFLLAALAALAFVSCTALDTTTPAPTTVPVPAPVATPDVARTEAQVRKVEEKVDDVEDAVRDVGHRLDAARATADSIEVAVEDAYANGLAAGSAAADELRSFVGDLKAELEKSTAAREQAMQALAETKAELVETTKANAELRSQVTAMAEQNKTLTEKLKEANVKIEVGVQIAKERDAARTKLTKTEEKLDAARKYVWGVWIGILLIVAYVVLKVLIATGRFTPQGRMASFLLR